MSNQLQERRKETVSELITKDAVKVKFNEVLGKKAPGFIASVITASKNNLKDVEPNSILKAAMTAATLDLPVDPNLGFAYMVPYNAKVGSQWVKQAQFQMSAKGYIQLAIRTGQYEILNSSVVYKGEIKKIDRLTGEIIFNEDESEVDSNVVVGYLAHFRLINGFRKTVYMSKEQMEAHGKKYSKNYGNKNSLWSTDFDSMALKTVMKRLLSKYGILSIEMQTAILNDQAVVDEEGNPRYADSAEQEIENNANKTTLDFVETDFTEVSAEADAQIAEVEPEF